MITGSTQVFALLGDPVTHSRSPDIWRHLFAEAQMDATYVCLRVPAETSGERVVTAVRDLGFTAVNLTIPHKVSVLPYLDRCAPSAARAGAANLLVRGPEGLVGHQTDGEGLLLSLESRWAWRPQGARVLLLGAGGAARSIAAELCVAGVAELTVLNRSIERAQSLRAVLQGLPEAESVSLRVGVLEATRFDEVVASADVVINATSGAASEHLARFDASRVPTSVLWVDINYWQQAPPLLAPLRARGLRVDDGFGMLLGQAILGFALASGRVVSSQLVFERLSSLRIG